MDNPRRPNDTSSYRISQSKNIRKDTSKRQLMPAFKMLVPAGKDVHSLQDLFRRACKKHGFYISEVSDSTITGVFNKKGGLIQLFSCFSAEDKSRAASVAKLSVTSQNNSTMLSIRGLQGTVGKINELIETFKVFTDSPSFDHPRPAQIHRLSSESEEPVFTRQIESYTYYELSKVMSSQDYGVGANIAHFLSSWQEKYGENEGSSLPTALIEIKGLVDETVHAILAHFNISNLSSGRVAQHCRPSVEKYVFSKITHQISRMYELKYEERQTQFLDKVGKTSDMTKLEVMQTLEMKEKYTLPEEKEPYQSAIELFSMIQLAQTPIDKLNSLLEGITLMKTSVVDYWKGKQELSTMDDQLPVLIYVVSQVRTPIFVSQIAFLRDYISGSIGFDNELKILTDLDSVITYIINDWSL